MPETPIWDNTLLDLRGHQVTAIAIGKSKGRQTPLHKMTLVERLIR